MPVKAPGSIMSVSGNSYDAVFTLMDFGYAFTHMPFIRPEFLGEKLRTAKNVDGSTPVYSYLSGNRVVQYFTGCNSNETLRPVTPDDSRVGDIYWRFDILNMYVALDANDNSAVDQIGAIAKSHEVLLAEFEAHKEIASGDVSYDWLVTMQSETFSYLTTTPYSIAGASAGAYSGTSNILVLDFKTNVEYQNDRTGELLSACTFRCEQRSLVNAGATSF
jgi:hypothetical protein